MRVLRFLRNLRRDRTDIWDWRTYGRPSLRDFIELLKMTWDES